MDANVSYIRLFFFFFFFFPFLREELYPAELLGKSHVKCNFVIIRAFPLVCAKENALFFFWRNKTRISLKKINHGRLTIQNRGVEEHPPSTPLNPQHVMHVLQGCKEQNCQVYECGKMKYN